MTVRDGKVWECGRCQGVQGKSEEVGKRGSGGGGGCVTVVGKVGFEPGGEGKGAEGEGGVGEEEERM